MDRSNMTKEIQLPGAVSDAVPARKLEHGRAGDIAAPSSPGISGAVQQGGSKATGSGAFQQNGSGGPASCSGALQSSKS